MAKHVLDILDKSASECNVNVKKNHIIFDSIRAGQMTSRCARCVGSALPPTVCTAPMGKGLRATPTRTDTSDSGEKQSVKTHGK